MNRTPTAPGVRAGHFVEGRHFALSNVAQAKARAAFLAGEYGRAVYVVTRSAIGAEANVSHTAVGASSAAGLFFSTVGV